MCGSFIRFSTPVYPGAQWVFFAPTHDKQGKVTHLDLFHAGRVANI